MKKLINLSFSGKSIATSKGILNFDKDGACLLEDDIADSFAGIKGFAIETGSGNNEDNSGEKEPEKSEDIPENNFNTAENDENIDSEEDIQKSKSTEEDDKNEESDAGASKDADEDKKPIDFKSLTVPALKKYAKDNGINITGLEKKSQIIEAIKNQG